MMNMSKIAEVKNGALLFKTILFTTSLLSSIPHIESECRRGICFQCSWKNLTNIPSQVPSNVTSINLMHNYIEIIRKGTFQRLQNCIEINLSFNWIWKIESGAFQGLPAKLDALYLECNRLKTLRADMWRGLKYIAGIINNVHVVYY